ncbi:MAG: FAD-dependent oxidoreductase [Candidatus Cloacimonetes bacterium]|nr:FAD-dependent oxidoreductase [Candidatus Cloacimonadota bacterium]
MIKVILNGKEVITEKGKTILDVAREKGIDIPTLCHDEELKPFGSCWVCAVKVKDRRGFVTSCGTEILDCMEIITDSEDIYQARKMALELLLSDHYADCEAPCKIACPDHVDVQSYLALIANNQQHEAVKVIKETLPLPLSIGRVCPAFCEKECRRTLVEDPIAIRQLKRYAADIDLNDVWSYVPPKEEDKDKKIAIVGAGPSGLTCGYYLSNKGYEVTVFEASPEAGGWLRYGIPEYRLPKEILRREIELMCSNGMLIKTGVELGRDINLSDLSNNYDAVYLALGAQKAVPMNVKGSDLPGCYLGVDYLKDFMLGKEVKTGKKVAVVGGGNTAIDCARTARRLGAEVTIVYRRTRKEMPAEAYEVDAAEEEGIKFHFLTNPVEYLGDENGIREIVMEKMKLGDPDSSGRRRPEPTGEYFNEEYDTVIAAISQIPDIDLFAEKVNQVDGKILPLSRWSTADVDEKILYTGLRNVFAGGDFRLGPATAIEAIADGRRAAENIDKYLQQGIIDDSIIDKEPFTSLRAEKLSRMEDKLYKLYPKVSRCKMPELHPEERSKNFSEVELGFLDEQALDEADRCLECGCMVNYRCQLRDFATEYGVDNALFFGDKNQHPIDETHPFILRDPNKCIKCGRCVRICAEVQGAGVLGYIYRGFTTLVAPEFADSLTKTSCEACGKCITVCPVGALTEKNQLMKHYPLEDQVVNQSCGICGTGCSTGIHLSMGNISYITHPEKLDFNKRNLCFYGRFGWQAFSAPQRVTEPLLKTDNGWQTITWSTAAAIIKERYNESKNRAFLVSPHNTNEELLLMKELAEKSNAILSSKSFKRLFTDNILTEWKNNLNYQDLEETDHIVIIGEISHTLRTICRYQQRNGKKLTLIINFDNRFNQFADDLYQEEDLIKGLENFSINFPKANPELQNSEKTIFIYNRNKIPEKVMKKIWDSALVVCNFKKGSGILETSDWNNINGFRTFQINELAPIDDNDFLFVYGELLDTKIEFNNSCFVVAVDSHFDKDYRANLILPKPTYLEFEGSVISDDSTIRHFNNPTQSLVFPSLLQILYEAGLISLERIEPTIWLNRAERHLNSLPEKKAFNCDDLKEFIEKIQTTGQQIIQANVAQWKYLNKIQESCHDDFTEEDVAAI